MIDHAGIMSGMKSLVPSRQEERKLTDFIDLYCDHKDDCDRRCDLRSTSVLTKAHKDDLAFTECRHCQRFRPEGGTVVGADIKEVGIWKPKQS